MALRKKRIFKIISAIVVLFIVFFIMLIYLGFLDWKKTLITKISSESTRFIGQEVEIEDLSFNLFNGLTFKDISVRNPKGFDTGNLIHIRKLYLKARYRDLVKGTLYFDKISVSSPELTLMKDKNGNVNISERLRYFFKREPGTKYYIKEFIIDSGVFDFNNDKRYRNDNINLLITNLSSHPGTKTLIEGWMSYAEGSKVEIEGWACLKDEPKTFAVSIKSNDLNPDAFRDVFDIYKIKTENARIKFNLFAKGDTVKGIEFKSMFHITNARADFIKKAIKNIIIETDGILDIHEDTVQINSFLFRADDVSDGFLKGMIADLRKRPAYVLNLQIERLDLSELKLPLELETEGIITANNIHVEGEFKKNMQRLAGDINCVNCSLKSNGAQIEIKKETLETSSNSDMSVKTEKIPYKITAGDIKCAFKGTISTEGYHGNGVVDAKDISVSGMESKRTILKNTKLYSEFTFRGEDVSFKADTCSGKIVARISGTVRRFFEQDRSMEIKAYLPKIKVTDIRDSFWEIFPDSFLYAGLYGYVSSDFSVDYRSNVLEITGDLEVQDFILQGENGEYSIGPLNGTIPILYNNSADKKTKAQLPSFNRSKFEDLNTYFSQELTGSNYKRVTIDSLSYGFELLKDVKIWISKDINTLNIKRFHGNIFGGRLSGSALVNFSDGLQYSVGILIKGLSLTELCKSIKPIRGYLSGAVDGLLFIRGSGTDVSNLIGKADFWTYSTGQEETKISKEFLRKVGGRSLKTSLRDRRFDKGVMGIYLKEGFIIFHELEIENRNFIGMKDLSVKVAPMNNRIAIDHLMWTMAKAAQRLKE